MPWNESHATGHPEIDRQHRLLFGLIERMGRSDGGVFTIDTDATLDLLGFILQHFRYEEELMAACAYPEAKTHCETHRSLGHWIIKLREDVIGKTVDPSEFQRFLDDWWQEHVGGSDRLLAAYLAGGGRPVGPGDGPGTA